MPQDWGSFSKGLSLEALELQREYENLFRSYKAEPGEEKLCGVTVLKTDDESFQLMDRHDIVAEENSYIKVILDYSSSGDGEKFRNTIIRILGKKNSRVELFIIQREDINTVSLESISALTEDDADIHVSQYQLGSGRLYTGYNGELVGKGSVGTVNSIYFGKDGETMDLNYNMIHRGEDTESDIMVNGALRDSSKKIFKSNLEFKEGATGAKGSEEEYAILLDDTVRSISVPLMLCHEDDVEGNHAASAGKIDEQILFYIMTRGFSAKEAESLIIESKFTGSIDLLHDEELIEDIFKTVKERIK